jgi:hypothetical protein
MHENIQVPGSHIGLGFNGIVLAIVAERLAQPESGWKTFCTSGAVAPDTGCDPLFAVAGRIGCCNLNQKAQHAPIE